MSHSVTHLARSAEYNGATCREQLAAANMTVVYMQRAKTRGSRELSRNPGPTPASPHFPPPHSAGSPSDPFDRHVAVENNACLKTVSLNDAPLFLFGNPYDQSSVCGA
jgi:hypothetical protein